jgi:hypothetical protein
VQNTQNLQGIIAYLPVDDTGRGAVTVTEHRVPPGGAAVAA